MKGEYTIVNRHNIQTLSLTIKLAIKNAEYISIDTEFTGLGDKKTKDQNIEDRYTALVELAKTHAVNAVGLSVFELVQDQECAKYKVSNFHFVMLCTSPHKISPSSMSFLVEHGFDFNDQFRNGIPYYPGNDVVLEQNDKQGNTIFRDLVFLYQSFYAELPPTLPTFIADVSEMFTGKLFDTNERQQEDRKKEGEKWMEVEIKDSIKHKTVKTSLKLWEMGLAPKIQKSHSTGKPFCEQFANHGVCQEGRDCQLSHSLDLILDHQEGKHKSKKVKAEPANSEFTFIARGLFEQTHSAVFDAYMTGYIFGHYLASEDHLLLKSQNRLYLIGKQMPLVIEKSKYAKCSPAHLKKKESK
ncbi:Target of EGR1, member 1 (Nuclear) [Boothiomyces macroporosus]|uniref:Target of EGR1, member 1 (Nuclear) n=1 Tax=Boothiomyces macroporosus TaxID=261099 RepID=A0AAD5UDV8_9FUNG|nr:Target of EGR1, member 1 (Nuclear) [Boothiomyces macroporosus]